MELRFRWKTALEWAEHAHFLSWFAGWVVTSVWAPIWAYAQGMGWLRVAEIAAIAIVYALALAVVSSTLWWKFVGRKRELLAMQAAHAATLLPAESTEDPDEMLPLPLAARLAFEAFEGTVLGMQANRQPNAPDGPLCFMAKKLFMADMPVYGKRFPSSKVTRLGTEITFSHDFKRDASVVEDERHVVAYTDLTAKRADLGAALEVLKGAYRDR